MDTIKGLALIGTFIGVLIIFAMWVSLWENVWPVSADSIALGLRHAFAHLGCGGGREACRRTGMDEFGAALSEAAIEFGFDSFAYLRHGPLPAEPLRAGRTLS